MIAAICIPSARGRKCSLLEKAGRGMEKFGVETRTFKRDDQTPEGEFLVVYAPPGDPAIKRDDYRRRICSLGIPILGIDGGIVPPSQVGKKESAWWWKDSGLFRVYWFDGMMRYPQKAYPSDRWNALGYDLKPLRRGEYIVVSDSTEADHRCMGTNSKTWAIETINEIRKRTRRPIIYRPHPRGPKDMPRVGVEICSKGPFSELIPKMWCHVSSFTTCEIEALIEGVPNISLHPESFARPVSMHDFSKIETPILPDRQEWCNRLSYWQWTQDEIEAGMFWPDLGEMHEGRRNVVLA